MEVRIEGLTKVFDGQKGNRTTAVDNMSFVIPDGKLVGLLGPSGCGKSTTLYMIAGLHKPSGGHIYFGDEDVTNVPPENRGIGLVFQNYALYPHFTVMQNICFPLDNVRLPGATGKQKDALASAKANLAWAEKTLKADLKLKDKQAAELLKPEEKRNNKILAELITDEIIEQDNAAIENGKVLVANAEKEYNDAKAEFEALKNSGEEGKAKAAILDKKKLTKADKVEIAHEMAKIVDIERFLERKPKELSGGQQQRVAIARALAKRPGVLLLDEPLSNLDARLRLQTREEIKRIQRATGITTVFVTHDQEEAMSISDIIVVMKLGVIQQIGEPQYVYDEPANLFVAKFLGSPAINVFEGEIKDGKLYVAGKVFAKGEAYEGTYQKKVFDEVAEEATPVEEAPKKAKKGGKEENPEVAERAKPFHMEEVKDRKVYIGVRPEAFKLATKKDGIIPVDVDMVQHIGRDISVIGAVEGQADSKLRIIIPSELHEEIAGKDKLEFAAKRFYVFEEGGERII
ncbi:MAG: ATP-binding cassette domain-containing protein [Bacilli bacterium]|nr:ATP-binding cassette domain-containing protein [Bacilli bacterium]